MLLLKPFLGNYSVLLNSEETSNPELALDSSKAHGGTLVMWKVELDPYVVALPTTSPAFLPILLQVPGYAPSIHVALYLPTSGRDSEFVSALSLRDIFLDEVALNHACPVYIRGDANCNPRNQVRFALLKHFYSKHKFVSLDFFHPSHHHFTGNGLHDAQLDVLLYQPHTGHAEELNQIICKLEHPLVESAHDIIISSCHLPPAAPILESSSENISAKKIENSRVKVSWDEENTPLYQDIVSDNLVRLRDTWSDFSSHNAVSILLQSTNDVLTTGAAATNKTIQLGKEFKPKPVENPEVDAAQTRHLRLSKLVKHLESSNQSCAAQLEDARRAVSAARSDCKRATNAATMKMFNDRDTLTHNILESDPGSLFKAVKRSKSGSSSKIQSLKVGSKVYSGKSVQDGFFDSLSSLKSPDMTDPLLTILPGSS